MMSILVRNKETGKIQSFSKGSDAAMKLRSSENGPNEINLFKDVDMLAARGLRTLVFGYKTLDSESNL